MERREQAGEMLRERQVKRRRGESVWWFIRLLLVRVLIYRTTTLPSHNRNDTTRHDESASSEERHPLTRPEVMCRIGWAGRMRDSAFQSPNDY
jgi:hypothetical protein